MPELLVDFITSLDGYGAAEGWPGWWGLEGPEYLAWLGEQPEAEYTILLGANTYRLMSDLAAGGEPGTDVLAGLSKIVFSSTLTEPLSWPNTQLISENPVHAVRELKDHGATWIKYVGLIAAPEVVQLMLEEHPDVPLHVALLDRQLDEHKYIRPGLGDAGDRLYGTSG